METTRETPDAVYPYPAQSAIAGGRITAVDTTEALAMPGVLAALGGVTTVPFGTMENAELALFQSSEISYRASWRASSSPTRSRTPARPPPP